VRMGPKRPPIAAGLMADGSGVLRVARPAGSESLHSWAEAVLSAAPGLRIEEHEVAGPPVSGQARAAGWAEAAVLLAALEARRRGETGPGVPVTVRSPAGASATAVIAADGQVQVSVAGGDPLDPVVMRSYAYGAVHQALGWVRREGVATDDRGEVLDLTIRSFGILSATETPPVHVVIEDGEGAPVPSGDAVFAAVAAAAWVAADFAPEWPVERGGQR
jgi:xanthine dehydrogenase small subunit